MKAIVDQVSRIAVTSRAFRNDQLGLFYEELCKLTGSTKVLPMNSGAEAVESADKNRREWESRIRASPAAKRKSLLLNNNFHGRTLSVVSFSSDPQARRGFGPFTPGFKSVPFGEIEALEQAITHKTVAVLIEQIQGEAGVVIPPANCCPAHAGAMHARACRY